MKFIFCVFLFTLLLAVCYAVEQSHGEVNETKTCNLFRRTIEPTRLCEESQSHGERPFNSDVHVATVDLERVQVILIVTLFIMIVVVAKLGKITKLAHLAVAMRNCLTLSQV